MAMIKLYSLMTVISVLVRQFVLPNPFECFGENAALINWIAEPIIQIVAYGIVGLFYVKGMAPVLGSLAYLLVYALVVGVLWVLGIFSFAWWWVLILVVAISALNIGGWRLKERFMR